MHSCWFIQPFATVVHLCCTGLGRPWPSTAGFAPTATKSWTRRDSRECQLHADSHGSAFVVKEEFARKRPEDKPSLKSTKDQDFQQLRPL